MDPNAGKRFAPIITRAPSERASCTCDSTLSNWRSWIIGPTSVRGPCHFPLAILGLANACLEKCLVQAAMHVATLDRKASLAGIHERAPDGAAGGDFDIGIVEHQHGIFTAKFQHHRQQTSRCCLRDSFSCGNASGEDQLVDRGSGFASSIRAAPVPPSPGMT